MRRAAAVPPAEAQGRSSALKSPAIAAPPGDSHSVLDTAPVCAVELGFERRAATLPVVDGKPGEELQVDTGWRTLLERRLGSPARPYDVRLWAESKVAPDHFAQVAAALYSLPTRFIGKRHQARADSQLVRFYDDATLVKRILGSFAAGSPWTRATSRGPPEGRQLFLQSRCLTEDCYHPASAGLQPTDPRPRAPEDERRHFVSSGRLRS